MKLMPSLAGKLKGQTADSIYFGSSIPILASGSMVIFFISSAQGSNTTNLGKYDLNDILF